jgi:hypothetical protein
MRPDLQGQALDRRSGPGLKSSDFAPGPCVWRENLYEAAQGRSESRASFALSARKVRRFAEGKPPWQHIFPREDMNFHMLEQGAFP